MSNTKTRKLTIIRTPTQLLCLEQGEAVHGRWLAFTPCAALAVHVIISFHMN